MSSFIKAISYYLPNEVLDNEKLHEEFPEWSIEKIAAKTGIKTRHISKKSELSSDLAVAAAKKLFTENNISPNSIDFILLCTQSPDYFLPTTACLVQERLDIPTHAGALDFNLGCSGFVYGLALAKGLIVGDMAKNVLLLTAETYSKYIKHDDKSNRTIFGDAGAAILITAEHGLASLKNFCFGTDGKGENNLIVKSGGMRFPAQVDNANTLYMNGPEIFNFTLEVVPQLIKNILQKNFLTEDDIDYFILHQANQFILDALRKLLNIPEEKFFIYLAECGNTVSSTIPIAMHEAIQRGVIKKGQRVLIAGFGVGYSWGGTIVQF